MKLRLRKLTLTRVEPSKPAQEPCTCGCCQEEEKDEEKK